MKTRAYVVISGSYCPCDVCCGGRIGDADSGVYSSPRDALEAFWRPPFDSEPGPVEASCYPYAGEPGAWFSRTGTDYDGAACPDEATTREVSIHFPQDISPSSMLRIYAIARGAIYVLKSGDPEA